VRGFPPSKLRSSSPAPQSAGEIEEQLEDPMRKIALIAIAAAIMAIEIPAVGAVCRHHRL